jgi:hypothetical protein
MWRLGLVWGLRCRPSRGDTRGLIQIWIWIAFIADITRILPLCPGARLAATAGALSPAHLQCLALNTTRLLLFCTTFNGMHFDYYVVARLPCRHHWLALSIDEATSIFL